MILTTKSGAQATWKNLLIGHCGIRAVTADYGDFSKNDCRVAGLVPRGPRSESQWKPSDWLSGNDERKLARFMQYGLVAAQEALEDAQWKPQEDAQLERTGVCLGSGIGAFEDICNTSLAFHSSGPKKVSPYFVPRILINLGAGHISMKFGFSGPTHAATTACTTGAHSIGDAARFIQAGDADVMVAGGAESCIHPLAFTGFERSKSLTTSSNDTPGQASRPFSRGRDGFVIAEGAAVLILEERSHAIRRGANIYAELAGYGASSDAHHLTQPPPDGHGALRAMQQALKSAGIEPERVDYVNAHATSTPLGDVAEANAVSRLFRDSAAKPLISSTKGATGHLLGAAGALEALFTVMAVQEDLAPATRNLVSLDEHLPSELDYIPDQPRQRAIHVALSNSFGFGGTNASLCFTKIDPTADRTV